LAKNRPRYIILHHSFSNWGCRRAIDRWHKRRGFGIRVGNRRIHVGYHYIVNNGFPTYRSWRHQDYEEEWDGKIEKGRPNLVNGAHCREERMNYQSLGICLIGNFDVTVPTKRQLESLYRLCALLCRAYGISPFRILYHNDLAPYKSCPGEKFPPRYFLRARVRHLL